MQRLIDIPTDLHLEAMLPLLILAGLFVWNFLLEIFRARGARTTAGIWTMLFGLFGIAYLTGCPVQPSGTAIHQMWIYDGLTRAGTLIVFLCLTLVAPVVPRSLRHSGHLGEYFALLSAAALGMVMLIGSNSLLMMFLALELFSLSLYLLCIFLPERQACQESGLKYFILSSLASAIIVYGMALVYGATGTTWLHEIAARVPEGQLLLMIGSAMIAAGFAFKISAVPFHMWTPDVYQGAPTPVTAFMSVGTKSAALIAMFRFFPMTLGVATSTGDTTRIQWWIILWSLAIMSMLVGNVMALSQTNLKRMLAYSGIAQAGYLLSAVFAGTVSAQTAMLYYLLVYTLMNIGAFLIVAALEEVGEDLSLSSLAGLNRRQPFLACSLALCLFSLTGLPPTAGFLAKFNLFAALLDVSAGDLPRFLVAAGLVGSLISAGYYLRAAAQIYAPATNPPAAYSEVPQSFTIPIGVCAVGVLLLSLGANHVLSWLALICS